MVDVEYSADVGEGTADDDTTAMPALATDLPATDALDSVEVFELARAVAVMAVSAVGG